MEEIWVRLKPLQKFNSEVTSSVSLSGSRLGRDDNKIIVAHSWMAKPDMMDENDEDLLFGSNPASGSIDPDRFASQPWDCAGCPPPFFDLPPPPRPDFLQDPDYCSDDGGTGGHPGGSPYESCDNPIIIDSNFLRQNDLFNILLVVISAIVVVLIILLIACVIWRKRVRLVHAFRKRNVSNNPDTAANDDFQTHPKNQFPHHFLPTENQNSFELSENPNSTPRHVYNNPNYPTLEIGGLPFFLMPSSSSSPSEKDTSLTINHPKNPSMGDSRMQGFYDHDYVSTSSQKSGPIYEDIDRMCTYRGAPPEFRPKNVQNNQNLANPSNKMGLESDRTYYNVSSYIKRPDSSGSTPPNCGTSSSEVSFESGSSPRHLPTNAQPHHGVCNPMTGRGFRTFSPSNSTRSPGSVYSARLAQNTRSSGSSVYYYSDTLKPRQNRGFVVDSDSGISSQVHDALPSQNSTPNPPPLPSARMNLTSNPNCDEISPFETPNRQNRILGKKMSESFSNRPEVSMINSKPSKRKKKESVQL